MDEDLVHQVDIYTDGSVMSELRNGASWAGIAWCRSLHGRLVGQFVASGLRADPQLVELEAVALALRWVESTHAAGRGVGTHITIWSDCLFGVQDIQRALVEPLWQGPYEGMLAEILGLIHRLTADHELRVGVKWVRRMSTDEAIKADEWAGTGAVLSRRGAHRTGLLINRT
jgi:ribonuclease HI